MNNLKFRVWTGEKFLYGQDIQKNNELIYITLDGQLYFKHGRHGSYKDYVIQRFTGMVDLYDVDIFEGDYVCLEYINQPDIEESKGVYEVIFDRGSFWLAEHKHNWFASSTRMNNLTNYNYEDSPPITGGISPLHDFNICRVIGNAFQNKKLIDCD